MRDCVWKRLQSYCLLELETTYDLRRDRILEVVILKVVNNEVVDEFRKKVNPSIRKLKDQEKYKDYLAYPTVYEIMPDILKFIKGNYLVGWLMDVNIKLLEKQGYFEYNKNVVDIYDSYYRSYKNEIYPFTLEYVYEKKFKSSKDFVNYDFDDPKDRALAIKQLYERKMDVNMFIYKELPSSAYIDFGNGHKLWINGHSEEEFKENDT